MLDMNNYEESGLEHRPIPDDCNKTVREADTLQLDIDSRSPDFEELRARIERFEKTSKLTVQDIVAYHSRTKGWHVIVHLTDAITDAEAIAYQIYLGSDPIRELISMARVTNNIDEPCILFTPKGRKGKSIY